MEDDVGNYRQPSLQQGVRNFYTRRVADHRHRRGVTLTAELDVIREGQLHAGDLQDLSSVPLHGARDRGRPLASVPDRRG